MSRIWNIVPTGREGFWPYRSDVPTMLFEFLKNLKIILNCSKPSEAWNKAIQKCLHCVISIRKCWYVFNFNLYAVLFLLQLCKSIQRYICYLDLCHAWSWWPLGFEGGFHQLGFNAININKEIKLLQIQMLWDIV